MLAKVGKSWQKIEEKCPRASFCLPCSGLAAAAALGKVRPLWRTGFSQPAAVFRLAGLWWPKSLRSKATHRPSILGAPSQDWAQGRRLTIKRGHKKWRYRYRHWQLATKQVYFLIIFSFLYIAMEEISIVVILIRIALAQVTQESPFDRRRITEMNVEESDKQCTSQATK